MLTEQHGSSSTLCRQPASDTPHPSPLPYTRPCNRMCFTHTYHVVRVCCCGCAGRPALTVLLSEDPYYLVRTEEGFKQPVVKLRISRLAKLISNPDLIAEYRSPPDRDHTAGSSSGGGSSRWAGTAARQTAQVVLAANWLRLSACQCQCVACSVLCGPRRA